MKDSLRRSYDRSARGYDETFRAYQRPKFEALLGPRAERIADLAPQSRVLDAGGGTGLLARFLDQHRLDERRVGPVGPTVTTVDFSFAMLTHAPRSATARLQADVERLPFRDGVFEATCAFTVLGILPGSPARALAELARVTRRGGLFVVSILRRNADELDFGAELKAAGFRFATEVACGQDVGYVCVRA